MRLSLELKGHPTFFVTKDGLAAINEAAGTHLTKLQFIGVQFVGIIAVAIYTSIAAFIIFGTLKKTIGLRVEEKEEIDGLDGHEHGMEAYPDFI